MELRGGADGGAVGAERLAAGGQHRLQVIERREWAVGNWLVGQRPEAFSGLQFGRIGGQEDQIDPVRHDEIGRSMPTGLVEHHHRPMLRVDPLVAGELGEGQPKRRSPHRRQEAPPTLAGLWADEAVDVQPVEPPPDPGRGPLADRAPDAADQGEEAKAMLVLRPERYGRGGMGVLNSVELALEPPLTKAAWATGSARSSRGRGRCGENPRRWR